MWCSSLSGLVICVIEGVEKVSTLIVVCGGEMVSFYLLISMLSCVSRGTLDTEKVLGV